MDTFQNTSDYEEYKLYEYICLPEGCYAVPILKGINQLYMQSILINFEKEYPQLSNKIINAIETNKQISNEEWKEIKNNFHLLTEESTDNVDKIIEILKDKSK